MRKKPNLKTIEIRSKFLSILQQFHKKELSTTTHIEKKLKIDLHNTKQFIKNHTYYQG